MLCAVREALLHANRAAKPAFTLPGLLDCRSPAQSRQREANKSDSSTAERSARAATRWVHGRARQTARSLTAKCQTNLVLSVRSASFPNGETERQRSVAVGKWPCSRLMPMSWPGEASRPYCLSSATGGASRRIAVSCPCEASRAIAGLGRYAEPRGLWNLVSSGAHDCFLTVSPVCGRRNEAKRSAEQSAESQRSGVERVQSWRVSHRARAEPCRYLARRECRFGASALAASQAQVSAR